MACPVSVLFEWNRRIKRLWYGVKFYKRYGAIHMLQGAIRQALTHKATAWGEGSVLVVHPPFRPGAPNVFKPLLQPVVRQWGWHYIATAFTEAEALAAPPSVAFQKHRTRTQRLMGNPQRYRPTPRLEKAMVSALAQAETTGKPLRILVFDDIMTTGSTLQACNTTLQQLFQVLVAKRYHLYDEQQHDAPCLDVTALVFMHTPLQIHS